MMATSPTLKSSAASACHCPRAATTATPASVTATPSICSGVTRRRRNNTPPSSTSTGITPWISARFTAVVWCAAV